MIWRPGWIAHSFALCTEARIDGNPPPFWLSVMYLLNMTMIRQKKIRFF